MKTVYSASNISFVSIFQNILEGHGIRCWIKNEFLSAGIGEIPPIECWPQLCVDDDDFSEAKHLVEKALSVEDMPAWKCDSCGEKIEGQFTECWNCGRSCPSTDQYLLHTGVNRDSRFSPQASLNLNFRSNKICRVV